MRAATKLEVLYGGLATEAVWVEVMEFHKCPLVAAMPSLGCECAATTIPEPDCSADLRGNVA
jgi:hypothetical protein